MFHYYITINPYKYRYINLEVYEGTFYRYLYEITSYFDVPYEYELESFEDGDTLKYVIKHNDVIINLIGYIQYEKE